MSRVSIFRISWTTAAALIPYPTDEPAIGRYRKVSARIREGKPLGERGAYWLAIHLANCYWKKNKVSFDQRLACVHQHEQEIMAFAEDPIGFRRFWDEADKLWMFLAAGKEWKHYREEDAGFRSHLPVSMDGTCNGYPHLSAMGRDPIGGRATNLDPATSRRMFTRESPIGSAYAYRETRKTPEGAKRGPHKAKPRPRMQRPPGNCSGRSIAPT